MDRIGRIILAILAVTGGLIVVLAGFWLGRNALTRTVENVLSDNADPFDYAAAADLLERANPAAEVEEAVAQGDFQFRGVFGIGLSLPDVPVEIQWLYLDNLQITDKGLRHLGDLRDLRYLQLDNTGVTARGVRELQEAFPRIAVWPRPVP